MKVDLIDYTKNGMHKIAEMARGTRNSSLDMNWIHDNTYRDIKETFKSDEKFVRALLKVKHLGILEHINFTFHISEVSRVLTHQLVRHRLASYLQMSGRHAKPGRDDFIVPDSIRKVDKEKGSDRLLHEYINCMIQTYQHYTWMVDNGVPIEDARYVLPPAFFTHISMTINARTLKHFLELRLDKHAQWEIRQLAREIFKIVYNKYPVLFEDLKDKFDKDDPIRLAIEHSKTMNALAESGKNGNNL